MFAGSKVVDVQGRSYGFTENASRELVDTAYHGLLNISLFGHNPENLATITVS